MSVPSYFSHAYHRFFFLHGNTDDEFCPPSLGILTLEEMLHAHLQHLGYQRIVFYNGRQKIYFHDSYSRQISRPDLPGEEYEENTQARVTSSIVADRPATPKNSRLGSGGPLGGMSLLSMANAERVQANSGQAEPMFDFVDSSLQLGNMNDSEVVGFIARCVDDEQLKTALIFTDGLDFITHFDAPAQRHMSGVLTRSGQLPSTNHNIYLFILPHTELQNIRRLLERHEWHFLLNQFFQQDYTPTHRVIFIGSPRQDEVGHLLNYWRLKRQLPTAWQCLPQSSEQLARELCGTGASLKSLSYELQHYDSLAREQLAQLSGHAEQESALERLRRMRGLEIVTSKIERLLARYQELHSTQSELTMEQPLTVARLLPIRAPLNRNTNLHLVLKGNPGTGKTTVAQLIAEVYRDAGLLELGHLIKVSREDLVAGYVGQTAIQTAQKISDALGGVLFIDEAYRLSEGDDNDFGREAIETIMEAMSNHLGEFSVIIAGYPEPIEHFLDANPGLRRRFSASNALEIPDYDPETLHHIFLQLVADDQRSIAPELADRLPDFFTNWHAQRDERTFGNAGEVINLYQEMDERRIVRSRHLEAAQRYVLTPADIPERLSAYLVPCKVGNLEDIWTELEALTGLPQVKQKVRSIINGIKVQQLRDQTKKLVPGHYLFIGNPGTGKTSVAQLMGRLFYALGLLRKGHLVEVGRTDLTGSPMQSSATQTRQIINKSLDGVLFIEDAYQLIQSEYDEMGREAIKTLLSEMEKYRDRLCVIFAGHPNFMTQFLKFTPSLNARIAAEIRFDNYQPAELLAIFQQMATVNQLQLAEELTPALLQVFEQWITQDNPSFGNAHEVGRLLDEMMAQQNDRLVETDALDQASLYQLTLADLEAASVQP